MFVKIASNVILKRISQKVVYSVYTQNNWAEFRDVTTDEIEK